jgi:hypothetical protein
MKKFLKYPLLIFFGMMQQALGYVFFIPAILFMLGQQYAIGIPLLLVVLLAWWYAEKISEKLSTW